jgi:hypothetical protein
LFSGKGEACRGMHALGLAKKDVVASGEKEIS